MLDLIQLLPHSKKDAKLDTKSERQVINEVADMKVIPPPLSTTGRSKVSYLLLAHKKKARILLSVQPISCRAAILWCSLKRH